MSNDKTTVTIAAVSKTGRYRLGRFFGHTPAEYDLTPEEIERVKADTELIVIDGAETATATALDPETASLPDLVAHIRELGDVLVRRATEAGLEVVFDLYADEIDGETLNSVKETITETPTKAAASAPAKPGEFPADFPYLTIIKAAGLTLADIKEMAELGTLTDIKNIGPDRAGEILQALEDLAAISEPAEQG